MPTRQQAIIWINDGIVLLIVSIVSIKWNYYKGKFYTVYFQYICIVKFTISCNFLLKNVIYWKLCEPWPNSSLPCWGWDLNNLGKLEQLERLRSEDTLRRLMITHTIESCWIPSQNKVEWPWRYRSRSKVITCNTPSHASYHLYQIWKESIQNYRPYRADTIFKVKAEWPWKYRSRSKVITCDTPSNANDDLCQIWKECKQNCRFFSRWKPKKLEKFAKN